MYKHNVGVVLQDSEGRVLIGERVHGGWSLPQGGIKEGEDPSAAASRELYEEVGLRAVTWSKPLADRYTYMIPSGGGKIQYWITGVWRGGEVVRFDLGPYVEFKDSAWVTPQVALERCVWFKKSVYKRVLKAVSGTQ